jgi:hypothetical protein
MSVSVSNVRAVVASARSGHPAQPPGGWIPGVGHDLSWGTHATAHTPGVRVGHDRTPRTVAIYSGGSLTCGAVHVRARSSSRRRLAQADECPTTLLRFGADSARSFYLSAA